MLKVGIIDYGINNIHSIAKALDKIGVSYAVTSDASQLCQFSHLVLPGVGAFGSGMQALSKQGLDIAIKNEVSQGTPILGICLGMQLLYEASVESKGVIGLGLLDGVVESLPANPKHQIHIPHVGWNEIEIIKQSTLFNEIPTSTDFYFVHSYCVVPTIKEDIVATCLHGVSFPAIVEKNHIVGVQFHPEKSLMGLNIIKSFIAETQFE